MADNHDECPLPARTHEADLKPRRGRRRGRNRGALSGRGKQVQEPQSVPRGLVWRRGLWQYWAVLACLLGALHSTSGWREWSYEKSANTEIFREWSELWQWDTGPHGRRGHSMVLSGTKIILFGGRDNEKIRNHIPRTYEIKDVNGTLAFESYDRRYVVECGVYNASDPLMAQAKGIDENSDCVNVIPTGGYFNDVWGYELNCTRKADESCTDGSWHLLHIGAEEGACEIVLGRTICTFPTERWLHGAAMFNDSTMLIYGGFSQKCEDYCDDMWSFDLNDEENPWMEIYPIDHFSAGESPGRRWKFSVIFNGEWMMFFGGFRVWHGFATDNSEANRWESDDLLPLGGYLDDIWMYTKRLLDPGEKVPTNSEGYGVWEGRTRMCPTNDDGTTTCEAWPRMRAGHASTYDKTDQYMWIHGGFTAYFPYIKTGFRGAGYGATPSLAGEGFTPYPNHPFYLDDLWYYDLTTQLWKEVAPLSVEKPLSRVDHSLEISGHILYLFGGYADNYLFDDTWQYNKSSSLWFEKKVLVHAKYPDTCRDDWLEILNSTSNCTELMYPEPRMRDRSTDGFEPFDAEPIENLKDLRYFDENVKDLRMWYYGIVPRESEAEIIATGKVPGGKQSNQGDPLVPYAATGPYQFVRRLEKKSVDFSVREAEFNDTIVYISCTSAELDVYKDLNMQPPEGEQSLLVPIPRRRSPGWDGCTGRQDGKHLLDNRWAAGLDSTLVLDFERPPQRADHRSIYIDSLAMGGSRAPQEPHASGGRLGEIYIFGGMSYSDQQLANLEDTYESIVKDDFWRLGIHDCMNNCSNHGVCEYGFCHCYDGYYGVDCSNQSCPGDYCYWDDRKHEQVCSHCCFAGWHHSPEQTWIDGVNAVKIPCGESEPGDKLGVCDGYGHCHCQPPYVGDDCSIRDCEKDPEGRVCSDNGYCSIEFPISRCICNPGYYGEKCEHRICLNNCSYPKGDCNSTTGICDCHVMKNPYNNRKPFEFRKVEKRKEDFRKYKEIVTVKWAGQDCSYIMAYAAGQSLAPNVLLWALVCALASWVLLSTPTNAAGEAR